jgi:hypothetical protein
MHSNAVDLPQSYGRFVRGTNLLSLINSNFLIIFDDEAPDSILLLLFTTTLSLGGEGKSRSWAVQPSALEPELPNRPLVTLSCSPNKKETTVSRAVRMLMHRLLVASSDGGGEGGGMMMIQQQHGRSLPWPMPKPTTDPSQTKSHRISYGGLRTYLKIVVSACYHTSLPSQCPAKETAAPTTLFAVRYPLSPAPNKESQHFSRSPLSINNWHLATIGVALSTITLR